MNGVKGVSDRRTVYYVIFKIVIWLEWRALEYILNFVSYALDDVIWAHLAEDVVILLI